MSPEGAGKTYTLAGHRSTGEPGIQDLAISDLLRLTKESFEVRLTALEIYNESIQDKKSKWKQSWLLIFAIWDGKSKGIQRDIFLSTFGWVHAVIGMTFLLGVGGISVIAALQDLLSDEAPAQSRGTNERLEVRQSREGLTSDETDVPRRP